MATLTDDRIPYEFIIRRNIKNMRGCKRRPYSGLMNSNKEGKLMLPRNADPIWNARTAPNDINDHESHQECWVGR